MKLKLELRYYCHIFTFSQSQNLSSNGVRDTQHCMPNSMKFAILLPIQRIRECGGAPYKVSRTPNSMCSEYFTTERSTTNERCNFDMYGRINIAVLPKYYQKSFETVNFV